MPIRALCLILLPLVCSLQVFGLDKDSTSVNAGQGQQAVSLYRIFPVGTGYTESIFSLQASESELTQAYLVKFPFGNSGHDNWPCIAA